MVRMLAMPHGNLVLTRECTPSAPVGQFKVIV